MHFYEELKKKYKNNTSNPHLGFAISNDIYPLYEKNDYEFEECNDFFKVNKENMLEIQYMLRNSYENFLEEKKLIYQINSLNISHKDGAYGEIESLKEDTCKYFYDNKEFNNNEFWNNFL